MIRRPPRSTLFPSRRSSDLWWALLGVAGTPEPLLARMGEAARGALAEPEVRARIEERGADVVASSDRKSTRLNSSHANLSYAVFCLKKKKNRQIYHSYTHDV